jgi:hypothetical protein
VEWKLRNGVEARPSNSPPIDAIGVRRSAGGETGFPAGAPQAPRPSASPCPSRPAQRPRRPNPKQRSPSAVPRLDLSALVAASPHSARRRRAHPRPGPRCRGLARGITADRCQPPIPMRSFSDFCGGGRRRPSVRADEEWPVTRQSFRRRAFSGPRGGIGCRVVDLGARSRAWLSRWAPICRSRITARACERRAEGRSPPESSATGRSRGDTRR